MGRTRRSVLLCAGAAAILGAQQETPRKTPLPELPKEDEDEKMPNGKSRSDAIAKEEHEKALKDTDQLIAMAQQLKDELQKAGDYVVPLSSVKRTEEIEKLARRIRGRLKQ
jgi:Zn-dependent oligopeptidase